MRRGDRLLGILLGLVLGVVVVVLLALGGPGESIDSSALDEPRETEQAAP